MLRIWLKKMRDRKLVTRRAFSIVELLVIIIVIAVLVVISILSYTGIVQRANATSLQGDLTSNAKKLKLYLSEYGSYPTSFDANNCPLLPVPNTTNYCLSFSGGNSLKSYETTNNIVTNSFLLIEYNTSTGVEYRIGSEGTTKISASSRTSCLDILNNNESTGSGTYSIKESGQSTSSQVYCDMLTDGGGWTIKSLTSAEVAVFGLNWAGYTSACANAGMPSTGRGAENINVWLAAKRFLYNTSHPLMTNWPNANKGHLTLPIHANVNGNDNLTMGTNAVAILPTNQIGDWCNSGEELCGYWFSSGWSGNNLATYPDPEDYSFYNTSDYYLCIFK